MYVYTCKQHELLGHPRAADLLKKKNKEQMKVFDCSLQTKVQETRAIEPGQVLAFFPWEEKKIPKAYRFTCFVFV